MFEWLIGRLRIWMARISEWNINQKQIYRHSHSHTHTYANKQTCLCQKVIMKSWWPNGLVFEAQERFKYGMKGKEEMVWYGGINNKRNNIQPTKNTKKYPKKILTLLWRKCIASKSAYTWNCGNFQRIK